MHAYLLCLTVIGLLREATAEVTLTGYETLVVSGGGQSTVTPFCLIVSNVVIDENKITWGITNSDNSVTVKTVTNNDVAYDSDTLITTLTVTVPSVTTTYACRYSEADTNATSTVVIVDFTTNPMSISIVKDVVATLTCTLPSTSFTVSLQWYKGTDTFVDPIADITSIQQVSASGDYKCIGTYTATGDFSGGSVTSDTATVTQLDLVTAPSDLYILSGQTGTLTCTIPSSTYAATLAWWEDLTTDVMRQGDMGTHVDVVYTNTYESTTEGQFYCKVEYPTVTDFTGGTLQSVSATVNVIMFQVSPDSTNVGQDHAITLTCKITSSPYIASMTWFKDNSEISGSAIETQANQESLSTTKITGAADSGGVYFCRATFTAGQEGLTAGFIDSTKATITIVDVTTFNVVAEKSGSATLKCEISGASADPGIMKFTLTGADYEVASTQYTTFAVGNGVKDMTLALSNVQSDASYTCVVGWDGNTYDYVLAVDVIEISTESLVYGLAGQSGEVSCVVADSSVNPTSVYWNDGASNIMAEGDTYLPKIAYDSSTITATLQIKSVSGPLTLRCLFEYTTDGVLSSFEASTELKVIYIEVGIGGALQYVPGLSTLSCQLTSAETQPQTVYWTYLGDQQTTNVTTDDYSNGAQLTKIKYWGADHDSNFYCYFTWGSLVIKQPVPVEVGELSLTGLVLAKGDSGKITCTMKDFGVQPTKITWSKGLSVDQEISINSGNTETSWTYQLSSVGESDATNYKCGITLGDDMLSTDSQVVVVDALITTPPLIAQGEMLTLTCQAILSNIQGTPTVSWIVDGVENNDLVATTIEAETVISRKTLSGVDVNTEVNYKCIFEFTYTETRNVSTSDMMPDILVYTTEPVSQYGAVGDVAGFSCLGESGNSVAGTPSVNWYNTAGVLVSSGSTYNLEIPEGGFDVTCKITYDKTDIVLTKSVSAIVSNIEALTTQYTTVNNGSVVISCTYNATSDLGNAPTSVKWYRLKNGEELIDLDNINGYTISSGTYVDQKQTTTLTLSGVQITYEYDKHEYQCEFAIEGQPIIRTVTLRVLGIHLNIGTASVTHKSGELIEIVASVHYQDYGVTPTYIWLDGTSAKVRDGNELIFKSIRVADSSTYTCNGRFMVDVEGSMRELDVMATIDITVTASCNTGTITNIKDSTDVAQYVDNGWTKDIFCKDGYLLDDGTYNTHQTVTCASLDYEELSVLNCTSSCILNVHVHDTAVEWHGNLKVPGKYNLYRNDYIKTSCNATNNRTLPANTNSTYTCGGSGTLNYQTCISGCTYKLNSKISVTFPDNMVNPNIIPENLQITYECIEGSDTVYNPNNAFKCDKSYLNTTFIDLRICAVTIPWEYIIISIAIILTVVAFVMIFLGSYLYFRRQKSKLKILRNGDIYANPIAGKTNDVAMVDMFKPIPIPEYHARYKQLMVDDGYMLSIEYAKIAKVVPSSNYPITIAKQPMYKAKNRFVDILPYDATRVTLHPIDNDPASHYINASYIDGFDEPRKFIAAQGPKPETLIDFWRMMWEQNSHVIIMVTNFTEKGRRKCEEYWSDEKNQSYGSYTVECLGIVSFPDYKVRKLSVTQGAKSRIITHYHYEGWPDHGVPDTATSMISFAKRAFSDNLPGPIVIHCSAGVGRTGTIISLHLEMTKIRNNEDIDVYDTVCHLRKCRKLMVQTESQYVFLYRAINEVLRCGDTEIYAQMVTHAYRDLKKIVPGTDKTGLQIEYQRLVYIAREDITDKFVEATKDYNHNKNRYHNILPYEKNRVKLLHQTGVPGSDYINASHVPSYHDRDVYISTQAPKDSTIDHFWRMIYETGASTIVMMANIMEDGKMKCAKYWPSNDQEQIQYNACRVKLIAVEESAEVTRRELCLTNSEDGYRTIRLLRMWHFTTLTEKNMKISGLNIISVIEQMSRWQKQQGNTPAVVHCSGGVGRAGAYIAIANCLEQLKLEGTVDVFQAVLNLRRARPFMVQSLEQYDYIYKSLVEYVESFDTYENFK